MHQKDIKLLKVQQVITNKQGDLRSVEANFSYNIVYLIGEIMISTKKVQELQKQKYQELIIAKRNYWNKQLTIALQKEKGAKREQIKITNDMVVKFIEGLK